jgi:DNA-binding FadR family transcriptional regulator
MKKLENPARKKAGTPHRPGFKIPKAAEMLADHFRRRIIRGELKEGDRLPTEQVLIQQYGVSRSTFREAFLLLESDGLISVSRGIRTGALVHRPSMKAAARQMHFLMQAYNVTLNDLYQSLEIIEPVMVRLLAERATAADVGLLRGVIAKSYKTIHDDHQYGENAAEFHRLLTQQAGLISFALIMELMSHLVGAYFESASDVLSPRQNQANKVAIMKLKEKLVDLLEKHDSDGAEKLWRRYFEITREHLLRLQPYKAVEDVKSR